MIYLPELLPGGDPYGPHEEADIAGIGLPGHGTFAAGKPHVLLRNEGEGVEG